MRTRIWVLLLSATALMIAGLFMMENTALAESKPECGYSDFVFNEEGTLGIKKWVNCAQERTWNWDILKSANASKLTLSPGQQQRVDYTVTANATQQGNYAVDGWIWIQNTSETTVTINSVTDVLDDDGILNCVLYGQEVTDFPIELGKTVLACKYSGTSTSQALKNTATATYDTDKSITAETVIDWSLAATTETDECAAVSDTYEGALGTVCASDTNKTFTFTYSRDIGPYAVCGDFQVDNIASFISNDTSSTGSSSWTVDISVPCAGGCSLTPGYWKTHSSYGPAPYDDTWALIGENTPFFLSGKTYYQVLWTAPQGNAYYILAHAFIAAKLNGLNGADTNAISSQLDWAEAFFAVKTPTTQLSKVERLEVLTKATILDQYNNGYIGPGHCSE